MSTILIVGDERSEWSEIRKKLEDRGYTVFVTSREEALRNVEEHHPDVLIDVTSDDAGISVHSLPFIFSGAATQKEDFTEIEAAIERVLSKGKTSGIAPCRTEKSPHDEEFRRSETRLRNLIELAPDGIVTLDLKGVITSCNTATVTLTGVSKEEIVGHHITALPFIRAQDIPHFLRLFTSIIRGEVSEPFSIVWHQRDGTPHSAEVNVRLLKEEGYPTEVLVVTRDVTDRNKVEEALQKSEEKYRTLFEKSRDAIVINSPDGTFLDVNEAALNLFGFTRKEIMNMKAQEFYATPGDRISLQKEVEKKGFITDFETKLVRKDGTVMDCLITSTAWKDREGTILGYDGIIRDITHRKRMEELLRKSEEQFRTLYENAVIGIYRAAPEGCIVMANPALVRMLGYSTFDEMACHSFGGYGPCSPSFRERIEKEGKVMGLESSWVKRDGTILFVRENARIVHDSGNIYYEGTVEDITERKKAEEQVKRSLEEKEILLREIHHRVKNNLQIISSLLSLQSAYIKEDQYAEMFRESQNRIHTMGLIHEKLYRSESLTTIDFTEYIRTLASELVSSSGSPGILLSVEVEDVSLGLDAAIYCGLIINELVTNSLKHAFPSGKGEIRIGVRSINKIVKLTVSDNGIGIPDTVDIKSTRSLGLRLVTILAEGQLKGKVKITRKKGTGFYIFFKK